MIPEIIIAEAAGRDEAVSAGVVELDEQPRPGDAADAAFEGRADLLAQEMRDEPVDRLALRLHGAPLRAGNIGRDLAERAHVVAVRQAVVAALHRADQRPVDDEVGIAADRRGEMRVAPQVETEMAVILRRVFGLRLAAQHDLVDQRLDVGPFDARQDAVEIGGPQRLGLRQ